MCDDEIESDFEAIQNQNGSDLSTSMLQTKNTIQQRISFEKYLEKTEQFLKAIHRGEIYEANFCMEFFAENAEIEPLHVFQRLNAISKAPFAVYFKRNSQYLLSASPERFLKKIGSKLISQPIKGTSKRFSDPVLDEKAKKFGAGPQRTI